MATQPQPGKNKTRGTRKRNPLKPVSLDLGSKELNWIHSQGPRYQQKLRKQVREMVHRDMEKESRVADCDHSHTPNAKTIKAMQDADAGRGLKRHKSTDEMWKDLGIRVR
jgi:hypothetical protein